MDYNTVKSELDALKREITKTKSLLRKKNKEIEEQDSVRSRLENNYQSDVVTQKQIAKSKFIDSKIIPIKEEITGVETKIADLEASHANKMSMITYENVKAKFSSNQEITDEIRESAKIVKDKLESAISPRFYNELTTQLETQEIELDNSSLENVIYYFNKQANLLEKMSHKSNFDILKFISDDFMRESPNINYKSSSNSVSDTASSGEQSDEGVTEANQEITNDASTMQDTQPEIKIAMCIIVVLAFVALFFVTRYVFPLYFGFLTILGSYNVIKNYRLYSIIVTHKAVSDNLDKIDAALEEEIQQRLHQEEEEEMKSFSEEKQFLEDEKSRLEQRLSNTKLTAEASFVFDDSALRKDFDAVIKTNENKGLTLLAEQREIKSKLDELLDSLTLKEREMKEVTGDLQSEYLNFEKVGDSYIFNPKFLLDIVDSKPIFFTHPETSCLFLYSNSRDVVDFIRLISMQLRIQLSPFNLFITAIDMNCLGSEYLLFQSTDSKGTSKRMFDIITDEDSLKEYLKVTEEEIQKRIRNIRREHNNIREYNMFMKSIDSVAEGYEFMFFQDPTVSALSSPALSKICINGGNVGIYTHLFIQLEEFVKFKEAGKTLVDNIGKIYQLQSGVCMPRAKDFVIESFLESQG